MRVTIAICTWNRAQMLSAALTQLTRLNVTAGLDWELLVVNNNCTDDTDAVIAAFSERLPLRRIFQPIPGLSNARNAAIKEAAGDYILWTDDDVSVDENWLAAYARAFERWPYAAVFGGPIAPWFEGDAPPDWLTRAWPHVMNAYATRDLGDQALPLSAADHRIPYGANFAIRMIEQSQHIYDHALGRRPDDNLLGGEETEVIKAILKAEGTGYWVPEAKVRHWIPRKRQTLQYIRDYYRGYGIAQARNMPVDSGQHTFFGKPLWLWRLALRAQIIYRVRRPFSGPETWVNDMITAVSYWAQLRSYRLAPKE